MDTVPVDWSLDKLSSVTKSYAGGTPDRKNKTYYGGVIPWVKSGEVNQQYISITEEALTDDGVQNSSAKLVEAGAILVAMYGATAGKVAKLLISAATNQAVLSIRSIDKNKLDNDFLFWSLRSLTDQMLSACQGAAQPNLSKGLIDGLTLLFPPVEEQKKIARILSTVDSKLALIDQQITATKTLKKGLMQKLFSQGVGTQDANGQWQPHTEFQDTELGRIPVGWEVNKLSQYIEIKHGWAFAGEYFGKDGPILLTPGNFLRSGDLYFNDRNTKRYSGEYPAEYKFTYGDLVVVMTDLSAKCEILGNMGIVDQEETLLHNQRIGKITLKNNKISCVFLKYYAQTSTYKTYIQNTATGTTVRHTSPSKICYALIVVPSEGEQQEITKILTSVDHKLTTLQAQKTQTQQLKKGLMQKLLTGQIRVQPKPQDM